MLGNSESKHSKRIKSNCEIYLHTIIAEIGKKKYSGLFLPSKNVANHCAGATREIIFTKLVQWNKQRT